MGWVPLKVKLAGVLVAAFLAAGVTDTVGFAVGVTAAAAIAIGGIFTILSNIARVWREAAEAERVRVQQVTAELGEQRELKHAALNEVAALKMKTDQTVVLERMRDDQREILTLLSETHREGLAEAAKMLAATETRLLEQISVVTRAQADLAVVVERIVDRLALLEST